MKKYLAILIFVVAVAGQNKNAKPSQMESWQCRNDLEIKCNSGKCQAEATDSFTPMSVSFDDSGSISVCAYSGCWEGTGKVFKNKNFLMLSGLDLKFSTSPDSAALNENIGITLDRNDNIGLLKAGSFAHPLICENKPPMIEQDKSKALKRKTDQ